MRPSIVMGSAILILLFIAMWSSATIKETYPIIETVKQDNRIVNPYFLIDNSTGDEIFKVDHEANIYTPQMINCDTIDTNANGLLSCGSDDDTTYSASNGIGLTGQAFSVAGNTCLDQDADGLSVTADCIGDTQLAFNTGQHLTTTSNPTYGTLTVTNLIVTGDINLTNTGIIRIG